MTHLRIRLLGQLSIEQNGNPITELSAKALEMFCYLLLYRDRPHTREALAAALWSDTSAERAQKYLRQTLWQLQTVLERQAATDGHEGTEAAGRDARWCAVPAGARLDPGQPAGGLVAGYQRAGAGVPALPRAARRCADGRTGPVGGSGGRPLSGRPAGDMASGLVYLRARAAAADLPGTAGQARRLLHGTAAVCRGE